MAKYKLACGLEFDIKPAGIGPESTELLMLINQHRNADSPEAETDAERAAKLDRHRALFRAIVKACCPREVLEAATLPDAMSLPVDVMLEEALPGMATPEKDAPKNSDAPATS